MGLEVCSGGKLSWKSCITAKYGTEDGGWFTPLPRGSYGVGIWKIIAKESGQLNKDCVFKLGMAERSYFGKTIGMEERPYVKPFPISIALLAQKGLWLQICGWIKEG